MFRTFALTALLVSALFFQLCGQNSDANTRELKRHKKYSPNRDQQCPVFTYQSVTDQSLQELRTKYNLDSVAGKGDDAGRAINLLRWMHSAVPHEDEYNHHVLTAMNIIDSYKEKKMAQGCYPLAIAMNELFLSMGFKSRVVICFSADFKHPNGGHVVTIVYMQKWILMDPQFNAYLKDKKGNFLSLEEVRNHVINGKQMVINNTANYHGAPTTVKYYINEFLAEHLYRFICPVASRYNSQTREHGTTMHYAELLPLASAVPDTGQFETHVSNGVQVITTHTNSAASFWAAP